jgi:uncharacterized membrane protein
MMITTLALATAGLFTGAAAYINAVEQPARLGLPAGALLTQWKVAYQRGTAMQANLALLGCALGIAAYLADGRHPLALCGAALMLASWPWTMVMIMPTNKRLMATDPAEAGEVERELIRRWAGLHLGRTAFGALATACFASVLGLVAG